MQLNSKLQSAFAPAALLPRREEENVTTALLFQHVRPTTHTNVIRPFLAFLTWTPGRARSCEANLTSWTNLLTAASHDTQVTIKDFSPYAYIVKGAASKWWIHVFHIRISLNDPILIQVRGALNQKLAH